LTATLLVGALGAGFWFANSTTRADDGDAGAGEIEAAMAAVEAWGTFAATGDIESVSAWFADDGPQFLQLQSEVGSIVPGGVYDFALTEAEVVEPGLVRGSVSVTIASGHTQTYRWDIELIQQHDRWKVWTVRTSP
jgi:hypothetical protein